MTAPAAGTLKARVVAFLEAHPGRSAHEVARVLGFRAPDGTVAGWVSVLLRDLERDGQVVSVREFRPGQGRQVSVWQVAPAGTQLSAPSEPGEEAAHRRARNRVNQRRSRARRRAPVPAAVSASSAALRFPAAPACARADPNLFFPLPWQSADRAKAICVSCPVQAACLSQARARGERYGIWGGVDLGAEARRAGLA